MRAWVPPSMTSEHTPGRFGRLKDDTTVLVVEVDLRSEAMRVCVEARRGSPYPNNDNKI